MEIPATEFPQGLTQNFIFQHKALGFGLAFSSKVQ